MRIRFLDQGQAPTSLTLVCFCAHLTALRCQAPLPLIPFLSMQNPSRPLWTPRTLLPILGSSCLAAALAADPPPEPVDKGQSATLTRTDGPAAGSTQDAEIAVELEKIRAEFDLPALAGAIVIGDETIRLAAVGIRRVGDETPVQPTDLWHLGSCTKAMTATLIARLVEQKKMRWDMTLGEVFGPLLGSDMKAAWKDVTLELLLANRAGVPADLMSTGTWAKLWAFEGTPREGRTMLVREILTGEPAFDPGTQMLYANAGFAIAGAMAETVMNEDWQTLLRRELFSPLGITSAGFGPPGTAGPADQPRGHNPLGLAMEPGRSADNPAIIGPAGTVHMSIEDWAKFARLHVQGGRGRTDLLLSPDTFKRLHEPHGSEGYALGWGVTQRPWAKENVLTHSGSNTLWFCTVWVAPGNNFAVLAATNIGNDRAAKAVDKAVGMLIRDFAPKHD